jgi:uncharacterized membrane protein YdjX (TVP38/TMEM64 family)
MRRRMTRQRYSLRPHYSRLMDSSAGRGDRAGRVRALIRIAAYAFVVGVILVVVAATGSFPDPDDVRDWGDGLGDLAVVACVPAFVVVNFVIAWPILAGGIGLLFGTAAGTPLALAGVTLAALAQMAVARYLVGDQAGRMVPKRMRGLERFLQRHGAVAVMESRIVPLLPFGAVNYGAGLTTLRFWQMALGTVVGAAPKVFGYVALGGSLTDLGAPEAKIAVGLLLVLAVVGVLVLRRQLALDRARGGGQAPA